jgi:hypothetical protein
VMRWCCAIHALASEATERRRFSRSLGRQAVDEREERLLGPSAERLLLRLVFVMRWCRTIHALASEATKRRRFSCSLARQSVDEREERLLGPRVERLLLVWSL